MSISARSLAKDNATTTVSIVVPVYAGEEYLSRLVDEVVTLRAVWQASHAPIELVELILVNDGAKDGSPELMDTLASNNAWIVPLHLARNYGQHAATIAGILHSSGDWIATIDEDLQHPPGRIPELLRHVVEQRADIAYARPTSAVHGAKLRDWTSIGFKRLLQWITGNPNLKYVNSFRLLRGDIARNSAGVAMHDTYFDINLTWFTERIIAVPMELRDERFIRTGKSGYRLKTLLAHAWRMLFSSHLKVLQLSTVLGLFTVTLSILITIGITVTKLISPSSITVQGWPSLAMIACFFGGITMFMLGVTLQYLSALVLRAHGKPAFFVIDRSRDEILSRFFRSQA
jgi:glycosyltransferase involved in cell wall biosynthesis